MLLHQCQLLIVQSQAQLSRDLVGYLLLHRQCIGQRATVLLPLQVAIVVHLLELCVD